MKRSGFICLWLVGILVNLPPPAVAQRDARSGTFTAPPNFFFRHLTTKDGLSYNLINCLHQDREGYIWVGTFNGLNRFDGQRFVTFKYDRMDPNTIAHNNILDICEDKAGNLWIATVHGVCQYLKAKNIFVTYLLERESTEAFQKNNVTNILCDRKGVIWATSLSGLYEFVPAQNAFKAYSHDPANPASLSSNFVYRNSLVEDPIQARLWIGSGKGLNCFDIRTKLFYNYRHNPQLSSAFNNRPAFPLTFDRQGRLLFADYERGKLVSYSPATNTTTSTSEFVKNNSKHSATAVASIYVDRSDNIWASARFDMVYHRDAVTNTWIQVKHDDTNQSSIISNFFWDALQVRDGTLFIGGLYGLSMYKPTDSSFSTVNPSDAVPVLKPKPDVTAVAEDQTGRLWIATDWNGLVTYDSAQRAYRQYPVAGHATRPISLKGAYHIRLIKNELWICTYKGVQIFNPATGQYRTFTDPPLGDNFTESIIRWSYQDKRQTMWFNKSGNWLIQFNPLTKAYKQHNLDSLSGSSETTNVTAVDEDNQGNIWFGTGMGRLYHYNALTNRFVAHLPDPNQRPKVLQQPINALRGDSKGNIWMASEGGGLIRYDPARNQFKSWMQSDGLLMDVCKSLLIDRRGKIWIGSYEGFTIFDPVSEKVTDPRIDNGQRENNFFSNVAIQLRNGKVLSAHGANLTLIDPDKISIGQLAPSPVISGITIFEKPRPLYATTPPIELTYKENFFTLTFSSSAAPQGLAVEYAYRLTNYDDEWVLSGSRAFAPYTGVKGGQYRFEVKARVKDGNWSTPTTLPIYIQPPLWETWWFRLGALGMVLGLIFLATKRREKILVREQREKSELRERIAASEMKALRSQMNPHFLYNSLNAIRLFVLQNDSDNADKYLVKFSRLMRLILENSRQEWVTLASELEQLQLYLELEQLRFDNKFDFSVDTDASLSKESVSIPPMIIQPYVENAILHGIAHKKSQGKINVCIKPMDERLECTVEDDGVGRQKAGELKSLTVSAHRSVGLKVTEERLQLINQRTGKETRVTVVDKVNESGQPAGTKVVIQLPLMHTL